MARDKFAPLSTVTMGRFDVQTGGIIISHAGYFSRRKDAPDTQPETFVPNESVTLDNATAIKLRDFLNKVLPVEG